MSRYVAFLLNLPVAILFGVAFVYAVVGNAGYSAAYIEKYIRFSIAFYLLLTYLTLAAPYPKR